MNVYAIQDARAKTFGQPYFSENDEVALRIFGVVVNKPGTQFNSHPRDFHLYHIGAYVEETGHLSPVFPPTFVVSADNVLRPDTCPTCLHVKEPAHV